MSKMGNFAKMARDIGESAQRPEIMQLKSGMITAQQARGMFVGATAQGAYATGVFGAAIGIGTGRDNVASFAAGSAGAGAMLGAAAGAAAGLRRGKAGKIVTDAESFWRATVAKKPGLMPKASFGDALFKDAATNAAKGKQHLDDLGVKAYSAKSRDKFVDSMWKSAPDTGFTTPIKNVAVGAYNTSAQAIGSAGRAVGNAGSAAVNAVAGAARRTANNIADPSVTIGGTQKAAIKLSRDLKGMPGQSPVRPPVHYENPMGKNPAMPVAPTMKKKGSVPPPQEVPNTTYFSVSNVGKERYKYSKERKSIIEAHAGTGFDAKNTVSSIKNMRKYGGAV